jgi:hypothetical protein
MWARACDGYTLTALITGEAGIGKSRLLAELAVDVHADGGRVLLGPCFEEAHRPYEPFAQILDEQVVNEPPSEVRRRARGSSGLALLAPALATVLREEPASTGTASAEGLVEAIANYVQRTAEGGPVLLIVEDLHWSTSTTHAAVRHLARHAGHAPVLIALTARDTRPDLTESLSVLLAELARLPGAETFGLGGLSSTEVATLLTQLNPACDSDTVHAETGGNPLFVRALATTGPETLAGSVTGILARGYAHLDATDLALLDLAAVIGSEFGADLLASAADAPLMECLEALERAESSGLVAALPGQLGRFAFTHALFRRVRYDALTPARRLRLHRAVADALERRADDATVSQLALHACIAAPLGRQREAVEHARRAAECAERALAPAEAADHYQRALDVAFSLEPTDPLLRIDLAVRLGETLLRAGRSNHREVLRGAASAAREHRDPERLALAAAGMLQYGLMTSGLASDPEMETLGEEALAALGSAPTGARARVQAALATVLVNRDPSRARALVHDAYEIATGIDDPLVTGQVLCSFRVAGPPPGDVDGLCETANALIGLGRRTGDRTFTIIGLETRAAAHREAGDLVASNRALDEYEALLGSSDLPHLRAFAVLFRSANEALAGDLAAAERTAREILTLGRRGDFATSHWYGSALWAIRHHQHRLGRFASFQQRAAREEPGLDAYFTAMLAISQLQAGREDGAADALERLASDAFSAVPTNFLWTVTMSMLCETAEMTRNADAGGSLVEALEPYSGRLAANIIGVFEPIDLALAQAALAAGDDVAAEAHASRAIDASRRRSTPIFLGRELVRLAAARRNRGADNAEIVPLVGEALDIADRTGAALIRHDATRHRLVASSRGQV